MRKTRDAFTGQYILYGWLIVQRVTQVAPEMSQFLDRGQSVMDDFICRFSLGISIGYATWLSPELLIRMVADVIAKIAEEQKEWGQHFP